MIREDSKGIRLGFPVEDERATILETSVYRVVGWYDYFLVQSGCYIFMKWHRIEWEHTDTYENMGWLWFIFYFQEHLFLFLTGRLSELHILYWEVKGSNLQHRYKFWENREYFLVKTYFPQPCYVLFNIFYRTICSNRLQFKEYYRYEPNIFIAQYYGNMIRIK